MIIREYKDNIAQYHLFTLIFINFILILIINIFEPAFQPEKIIIEVYTADGVFRIQTERYCLPDIDSINYQSARYRQ